MSRGRSKERVVLRRPWELPDFDGRLVVLAVLACYFGALPILGGVVFWRRLGVPHLSPSFADLRSITSGWECTRKGLPVLPHGCDPSNRPVNYPQLWLAPAFLGLGPSATVYLGVAAVLAFFASVWTLAGRLHPVEGVVYAAVLCSPAVMLGVERGNNDLVVFALVVLALVLFRRGAVGRAIGHGLLLFAGMLKLYPSFAFGVLVRQRRSWATAGMLAVGAVFAVYFLVTLDYIHKIERASPQLTAYSYGAGVLADLQHVGGLGANAREAAVIAAAATIAAVLLWRARLEPPGDPDLAGDAFCAGAGIYCGTYIFFHNFDYRLIFLVLTLPQLLRWAWQRSPPLPFPHLALAAMTATLWLGTLLPILPPPFYRLWMLSFPLDEYLNWLLFAYLGAGLALSVLAAARWPVEAPSLSVRAPERRTRAAVRLERGSTV
jgi:Glycosyltransferase family 87